MSDSRERFLKWASTRIMTIELDTAWEAWQAAEQETARRCAELCHNSTESLAAEMDIKAEFPEAWK